MAICKNKRERPEFHLRSDDPRGYFPPIEGAALHIPEGPISTIVLTAMDWVGPELVHAFLWLIAKALLSIGLSLVVFHISHNRVLAFVCFAVFWLAVLAKKSWR